MIKGFNTRNSLIDYVNELNDVERKGFINDLINYKNYLNEKYKAYRSRVLCALYDKFYDDKVGILEIYELSRKALNTDKEIKLNNINIKREYNNEEVCNIYNEYLEIVYKLTEYFSRIYSVASMFAGMAYRLFDFPPVESVITGTYNGPCESYDVKELVNKFISQITNIDNIFEDEWNRFNKKSLYKLK